MRIGRWLDVRYGRANFESSLVGVVGLDLCLHRRGGCYPARLVTTAHLWRWFAELSLVVWPARVINMSAKLRWKDVEQAFHAISEAMPEEYTTRTDTQSGDDLVPTLVPTVVMAPPCAPEQEWRGATAGQPDPPEDLARWCEECGERAAVAGTGRCAACNGKGR